MRTPNTSRNVDEVIALLYFVPFGVIKQILATGEN